jgi:hypothetical protein
MKTSRLRPRVGHVASASNECGVISRLQWSNEASLILEFLLRLVSIVSSHDSIQHDMINPSFSSGEKRVSHSLLTYSAHVVVILHCLDYVLALGIRI